METADKDPRLAMIHFMVEFDLLYDIYLELYRMGDVERGYEGRRISSHKLFTEFARLVAARRKEIADFIIEMIDKEGFDNLMIDHDLNFTSSKNSKLHAQSRQFDKEDEQAGRSEIKGERYLTLCSESWQKGQQIDLVETHRMLDRD